MFAVASANADNFTVTNTDDSGTGSLRGTVATAIAAGPSNTVIFDPTVTGTITLTSGQIRIDGPLTITGPGRDVLAIDGSGLGRIFTVFENGAPTCPALSGPNDFLVTISGLTLKSGSRLVENSAGGAIVSAKSLTVDSVTIRDSSAWMGGGIGFYLQYPGQTLTITNSQVIANFAKPTVSGSNGFHYGAGLAVLENCQGSPRGPTIPSTVSIANSLFSGNRTQPVNLMALGGAITSFSDADITITNTRIVDNHVEPPVSGARYYGGGIYGRAKSLTIAGSEIADNTADRGGGLRLFNDVAALQGSASAMAVRIINSTVSGNVVTTSGGALELYGNIALEIDNSTIANNNTLTNHTSGILLSTGLANPASAGNTRAPTLTLASSILANQPSLGGDVATNAALMPGFVIAASHSLIQKICPDSTCTASVTDSDNLLGFDPLLGPLADNGGPTRTHALLTGSPAIDTGSNPLNLATDQRGVARQQGLAPDMGAFELVDTTPPSVLCGVADGVWHNADVNIACTASDPESGLDVPADSDFSLPTSTLTGAETANAATDSRSVCNTLGECTIAGPIAGNMVDKQPPTITISSPAANATYQLNASVVASYVCSDGGSGVASCQGPVANAGPFDTSSTGAKTFTVTSIDNVGNPSTLTATYNVATTQTITFGGLANKTLAQSPVTVTATPGASGNPVTFSTTTPLVCTSGGTNGSEITLLTAGTCTVQADQAGNAAYFPAPSKSRSFTVSMANQTITFGGLANKTLAQSPVTVAATPGASGNPVTFSTTTPSVCTSGGTNGSEITLLIAGTCTVQADQAGDAVYNPAPSKSRSFTVSMANQTITFGGLANKTLAQSPVTVAAPRVVGQSGDVLDHDAIGVHVRGGERVGDHPAHRRDLYGAGGPGRQRRL